MCNRNTKSKKLLLELKHFRSFIAMFCTQKIVYIQDVVLCTLNCNGYHATHYNLPKLAEEDNFKSPTKLHT